MSPLEQDLRLRLWRAIKELPVHERRQMLGLDPSGGPTTSVRAIIENLHEAALLQTAATVLRRGPNPRLLDALRLFRSRHNQIPHATRERLFAELFEGDGVFYAHGREDLLDFIERVWDIDTMSAAIGIDTLEDDILQHCIRNEDWPDRELYDTVFGLLTAPDATFLRFLEALTHPLVRESVDEQNWLVGLCNRHMQSTGVELTRTMSAGHAFYRAVSTKPTPGSPDTTWGDFGLTLHLQTGDLIAGRFTVLAPLPRGGMAEVWSAVDNQTGQDVAVKCGHAVSEVEKGRFLREIRILSSVTHPNVIPVLAFESERQYPCYVMPLAECSLSEAVDPRTLSDHARYDIFAQVVEGVRHLHANGVVHRDLKPKNILRMGEREWAVADLGIAKPVDHGTEYTTRFVPQSEDYAAPEQQDPERWGPCTTATDVFQLGRVLHWLLTGGPGRHVVSTDLPLAIRRLILRCTAPDAGNRPSLDELLAEARRALVEGYPPNVAEMIASQSPDKILAGLALVDGARASPELQAAVVLAVSDLPTEMTDLSADDLEAVLQGLSTCISTGMNTGVKRKSLTYAHATMLTRSLLRLYQGCRQPSSTCTELLTRCILLACQAHGEWEARDLAVPAILSLLQDKAHQEAALRAITEVAYESSDVSEALLESADTLPLQVAEELRQAVRLRPPS